MAQPFRRDPLGSMLDGLHRYGDVVAYRFGPARGPLGQTVVAAYHPDDVHRLFTGGRQDFGRQTVSFEVLSEVFGQGLLTTDGETWLRQRRTLQPLFTPRRVAGYATLMAAEAERVVSAAAAGQERVVDLHELMLQYTLRVVGRALFGEEIDALVPELHRLVPLTSDAAFGRIVQVVRTPLGWPTPRNRRLVRLRGQLYDLVDRILAQHPSGAGADGEDMVARLRSARDPDTGAPLSAQEIRDQVLVFLLAGHETTAGALTFTLHLLGRHPDLQERIAAEAARADTAAAGADAAGGLARAALLEGMRLYPPAYFTQRVTTVDTGIGGYELPAGTVLIASPWVTHRHPEFWPEPERYDPARFLPERLAGGQERPRYAYFPFGGGARSCIGEHFALLEATLLLQAVLARYRVEALDPRLELDALVTLRPAGTVRVRLAPR